MTFDPFSLVAIALLFVAVAILAWYLPDHKEPLP